MFRKKPPQSMTEKEKANHPNWRRYTRHYQRKKRLVRDIWIGSGLVMLAFNGAIGPIAILAMMTTFLSLSILDETR